MKKLSFSSTKTIFAVLFLVGLFLINLTLSQVIMSLNLSLKSTQEQIEYELNQNRVLKVRAAKYTAIANLLKQAKKLGFVETINIVYLPDSEILAKND